MLNSIYILSPQDVAQFEALNAMPEQAQGSLVPIMYYKNVNAYSSVILTMTGTPGATIPVNTVFTNSANTHKWNTQGFLTENNGVLSIDSSMVFDGQGNAENIYCHCNISGVVTAGAGTLTVLVNPNPSISSLSNHDDAVVSGLVFGPCVDKTTIDNPKYILWCDILEANQPLSEREVITIIV